ncbi:30S ribosomal protein S12 methylthiotransferase RimO [Nitriliruptor alkaliphilus]|uniref:30S ribosomal protein S12 methylthiotransferase RimO n=1 Tax=Nitriliruptor alkaliphilus TaxID=427918 RepID=UPI00069694BF|nr:30S ribosomal protein S12 methylthiotransferase RimO [Nitriliruptor alkaliphilus]
MAIVTLGCGRNEVDTDQLAGLFHREGVPVVDDPAAADVVLVNTCTFIAPAKQESIDTVLEACDLKETGTRAVLVVGCMAERYPNELAEAIPEADAIVGFDGYGRLPQLVDDVLQGRPYERVTTTAAPAKAAVRPGLPLLSITPTAPAAPVVEPIAVPALDPTMALGLDVSELPPEAARPTSDPRTAQDDLDRVPATGPRFPVRRHDGRPWAYLKLASGCDRLCTFCAIPSFRGRFRSRPLDELVAEASWLVEQGARELVMVSENTTSWGKDLDGGRDGQARMVETLAEVDGLERLRLMYLQPAELTVPLLEVMAGHPKVASYFDLSLQHVSGPVVRRMARSGDHVRFGALIERIRGLDPHAVFRSNFILGFPGETEQDVQVLEDFLQDQRLDWVGLFAYSPEDGTPAATMPDQVDPDEAAERVERLAEVQERTADEAARAFVGRQLDVTVEAHLAGGPDDPDGEVALTVGRSYREAPDTDGEVQLVTEGPDGRLVPADLPRGRTVTAEVTRAIGVDLVARVHRARA